MAYLDFRAMERLNISNLQGFWAQKTVNDISARSCRDYAAGRPGVAGRRDLETLRAAVNHWHREHGPLGKVPSFALPPKPAPREAWLSRSEVARLLWAARRQPHLARFIIIGFYTGTRMSAILALEWSWIDLDGRVMRRRAPGEIDRGKKRRPAVRIGVRLLTHLKRWQRLDRGMRYVIHYDGKPVRKLRRSWPAAAKRAGVKATPHTLRHTRATLLMKAGIAPWEAAQSLGMSLETLERVYGHHHPEWQSGAAEV